MKMGVTNLQKNIFLKFTSYQATTDLFSEENLTCWLWHVKQFC